MEVSTCSVPQLRVRSWDNPGKQGRKTTKAGTTGIASGPGLCFLQPRAGELVCGVRVARSRRRAGRSVGCVACGVRAIRGTRALQAREERSHFERHLVA